MIKVKCNSVDATALIGSSWPVSMVSVSFCCRLSLTIIPVDLNYVNPVHNSQHHPLGRAYIQVETGGRAIEVCALVLDITTDLLLGIDALNLCGPRSASVSTITSSTYPQCLLYPPLQRFIFKGAKMITI